jgi:hypothetical protein
MEKCCVLKLWWEKREGHRKWLHEETTWAATRKGEMIDCAILSTERQLSPFLPPHGGDVDWARLRRGHYWSK